VSDHIEKNLIKLNSWNIEGECFMVLVRRLCLTSIEVSLVVFTCFLV